MKALKILFCFSFVIALAVGPSYPEEAYDEIVEAARKDFALNRLNIAPDDRGITVQGFLQTANEEFSINLKFDGKAEGKYTIAKIRGEVCLRSLDYASPKCTVQLTQNFDESGIMKQSDEHKYIPEDDEPYQHRSALYELHIVQPMGRPPVLVPWPIYDEYTWQRKGASGNVISERKMIYDRSEEYPERLETRRWREDEAGKLKKMYISKTKVQDIPMVPLEPPAKNFEMLETDEVTYDQDEEYNWVYTHRIYDTCVNTLLHDSVRGRAKKVRQEQKDADGHIVKEKVSEYTYLAEDNQNMRKGVIEYRRWGKGKTGVLVLAQSEVRTIKEKGLSDTDGNHELYLTGRPFRLLEEDVKKILYDTEGKMVNDRGEKRCFFDCDGSPRMMEESIVETDFRGAKREYKINRSLDEDGNEKEVREEEKKGVDEIILRQKYNKNRTDASGRYTVPETRYQATKSIDARTGNVTRESVRDVRYYDKGRVDKDYSTSITADPDAGKRRGVIRQDEFDEYGNKIRHYEEEKIYNENVFWCPGGQVAHATAYLIDELGGINAYFEKRGIGGGNSFAVYGKSEPIVLEVTLGDFVTNIIDDAKRLQSAIDGKENLDVLKNKTRTVVEGLYKLLMITLQEGDPAQWEDVRWLTRWNQKSIIRDPNAPDDRDALHFFYGFPPSKERPRDEGFFKTYAWLRDNWNSDNGSTLEYEKTFEEIHRRDRSGQYTILDEEDYIERRYYVYNEGAPIIYENSIDILYPRAEEGRQYRRVDEVKTTTEDCKRSIYTKTSWFDENGNLKDKSEFITHDWVNTEIDAPQETDSANAGVQEAPLDEEAEAGKEEAAAGEQPKPTATEEEPASESNTQINYFLEESLKPGAPGLTVVPESGIWDTLRDTIDESANYIGITCDMLDLSFYIKDGVRPGDRSGPIEQHMLRQQYDNLKKEYEDNPDLWGRAYILEAFTRENDEQWMYGYIHLVLQDRTNVTIEKIVFTEKVISTGFRNGKITFRRFRGFGAI